MSARPSGSSETVLTFEARELQAVLLELHVADDVGAERAGGVRKH